MQYIVEEALRIMNGYIAGLKELNPASFGTGRITEPVTG